MVKKIDSKEEFNMIYLDNAATTPIHKNVLNAMMPYLSVEYGNAGSVHSLGRNAAKAIENARGQVAKFMNAEAEQIIFTSGGSEGNNMVLSAMREELIRRGKTGVVISEGEHDSVYKAAYEIFGDNENIKSPFYIYKVGMDGNGIVSIDAIKHLLDSKSEIGLVSIMYVNNEVGSVNPIKEICEVCHEHEILFHTDCVQAAGSHKIDVEDIGCDFATVSGHKIYAPKGTGAVYVRDKSMLHPIIYGGAYQEFGMRGGTENVAGIVGFGEACNIMNDTIPIIGNTVYSLLQSMFYDKLLEELSLEEIVHINGDGSGGKTVSIRFDGVDAETLVLMMDARGVCISSGSACHGHESIPSRVLIAMGLTEKQARESVRISFSLYNTVEEVTKAATILASCVKTLIGIKNRR